MHWLFYLVIGIVIYAYRSHRKAVQGQTYSAGQASAAQAAGEAAATASNAADQFSRDAQGAGFYDTNKQDLKPAYQGDGWNPYPGWYRTGDGGWWNPDTGETYSQGSSPPALPEPGPLITINLPTQLQAGAGPQDEIIY